MDRDELTGEPVTVDFQRKVWSLVLQPAKQDEVRVTETKMLELHYRFLFPKHDSHGFLHSRPVGLALDAFPIELPEHWLVWSGHVSPLVEHILAPLIADAMSGEIGLVVWLHVIGLSADDTDALHAPPTRVNS